MKIVFEGARTTPRALAISGDVKKDRPAYLWPGILFMPSGQRRVYSDLSSKAGFRFWAKGDGRTYRVAIVGAAGNPIPEQVFKPGPDWHEYRFPFTDFLNLDPHRIRSIIIAASRDPGLFIIQLDEVSLY